MTNERQDDESAPAEELPPPETFTSVAEWYRVYRGRVPIQMAAGLDRLMVEEQIPFAEAYRRLVASRNIIEIKGDEASKTGQEK